MILPFLLLFLVFTNAESELTPEFLDELLEQQRYEEFSHYMDPDHVRPNDLVEGDIMVSLQEKELQRQGVNTNRYNGSLWPNRYVPIVISNQFPRNERRNIIRFARNWNRRVSCVRLRWRRNENDYVNISKGDGCWSYIGRIGGAQTLSLGNGCINNTMFGHSIMHTIGFFHEQNRPDRDDYIEVLWDRIPEGSRTQYIKGDRNDVGINGPYDFYTNMHRIYDGSYRIKVDGIDRDRVGRAPHLNDIDVQKIENLYKCEET